ncbi:hypothetical protein TPE_2217 [Treponema pedis str. T A4]|uniref:Uncharacterized protein n=1 Tax=Treponema pedis str. T A4 TaxID=1291379 RepID=S6A4R3_9SPIR|nr:hypothetical protein TPE_2217 [Treponema pedis str. T A4]
MQEAGEGFTNLYFRNKNFPCTFPPFFAILQADEIYDFSY